jgi:hypothetical protein
MRDNLLTNQAVKDDKEKGECNGVETLCLDPASRAGSGGVAVIRRKQAVVQSSVNTNSGTQRLLLALRGS